MIDNGPNELAPPVALPYAGAVTGIFRDAVIRTCDGEAEGEPDEGIAGVAWVIRRRAEWDPPTWWGSNLYRVCHMAAQFSCWDPKSPVYQRIIRLVESEPQYQRIAEIVDGVLNGSVADPTGGATTYKRTGTHASWDNAVAHMVPIIIGRHSFYKLEPHAHA